MNDTYEYFISFMYVDERGTTRLKNASANRTQPIVTFSDIRELQEELDKELGVTGTVIVSYQLMTINKEAHI